MKRTKYMMSEGLAFSEQKDMEKLRKKSLEGWQLKKFRCLGYEFEKSEPEDVIFSIDYRDLQSGEEDEYFDMFHSSGWTHVCSASTMHIFKGRRDTHPIYSDYDSSQDKMNRLGKPVKKFVAFCILVTIISLLIMTYTQGIIHEIGRWTLLTSLIFTTPAVMTYIAVYYHKWKLSKKGV